MKIEKSFALDAGKQAIVEQALEHGKKKHQTISHILCESELDASVHFDAELDDRET